MNAATVKNAALEKVNAIKGVNTGYTKEALGVERLAKVKSMVPGKKVVAEQIEAPAKGGLKWYAVLGIVVGAFVLYSIAIKKGWIKL